MIPHESKKAAVNCATDVTMPNEITALTGPGYEIFGISSFLAVYTGLAYVHYILSFSRAAFTPGHVLQAPHGSLSPSGIQVANLKAS